jgi:hypothetical protein
MNNKSYKEYSDEFLANHPELFDRVMLNVNATVKFSFQAHSHSTDEELIEMIRKLIADGAEIVCEMEFFNPNDENWEEK